MSKRMTHIEKNFESFRKLLPELPQEVMGKFALMREGNIVDYFDSASDAQKAGKLGYEDGLFSIQQVIKTPVELGFYSHAIAHN